MKIFSDDVHGSRKCTSIFKVGQNRNRNSNSAVGSCTDTRLSSIFFEYFLDGIEPLFVPENLPYPCEKCSESSLVKMEQATKLTRVFLLSEFVTLQS